MDKRELDLLELVKILWRRKLFIISTVSIACIITVVITLLLPEWYKATAKILPPSVAQSPFGLIGNMDLSFGQLFGGNNDQFRILSILKSRNLKEQVVKKYNLQDRYNTENIEQAVKKLEENIDVGIGDEMQIYVTMWDKSQDDVADIVNYTVRCLDSINIAISSKKAHEVRTFLEQRISEVIDSLLQLEAQLSDYMSSEDILSLEDQVRVSVEAAAGLKSELIIAEVELAVARKTLNPNDPKIVVLENKVNSLLEMYQNFSANSKDDNISPDLSRVPELGIKMEDFQRRVKYFASLLEFLGPQYEKAKIKEKRDIPTIEVYDWAVRPERKDKPHRALIVVIMFIISSFLSSIYLLLKYLKPKKSI